jgi:hypothetical protein
MFMATLHGPVPGQLKPGSELLQRRNLSPDVGTAVSVTTVPGGKAKEALEHDAPQLIPAGLLVTVPVAPPVEVFWIVSPSLAEINPPKRA